MALSASDRDTMLRIIREASIAQTDKRLLAEALGTAFSLTSDDKRSCYDHVIAKR